jgi:hypothetical protein
MPLFSRAARKGGSYTEIAAGCNNSPAEVDRQAQRCSSVLMQWVMTRLVGLGVALIVTAALLLLATMYARTNWPAAKQPGEIVINLPPPHGRPPP